MTHDRVSESGKAIEIVGPDITDALLISAYDIHHGLLLDCDGLLSDQLDTTIYAEARLLVVDSGGYELNAEEFESGEVNRQPRASRPFTKEQFTSIVDRLPTTGNILVVSFDSPQLPRQAYAQQRIEAQQFFSTRSHLKSDFLLKPEGSKQYIDVSSLTADASNLRAFDVIGVTEKELGATLLDRMTTLARLRTLLDETGSFERPIHLFGSLDPLLTPLYFMAGAEVFDGLSWLRYGYIDGLSIHPEQLAVIRGEIDARKARRDAYRYMSNLKEMRNMKHRLGKWASEPDRYEHLGPIHQTLREVYETMLKELGQKG